MAFPAMNIFASNGSPESFLVLTSVIAMVGSFIAVALLELIMPARRGEKHRSGRISVNFGLGLINLAGTALLSLSALSAAMLSAALGWGLFQSLTAPPWLIVPLLLLVLSLLGYGLHRLFHNFDLLWQMHAIHHADEAIDLSTSFRNHPLAHLLTTLPRFLTILLLGPDVASVIIAESIFFAAVLFQHANINLPDRWNDRLEPWLVTPRFHLIHHAAARELHDSNYGEIFTFWDRLFGTCRASSGETIIIGLPPPTAPHPPPP